MTISFRPYARTDADRLADVVQRAIADIGICFYTPAQLAAWAGRAPDGQSLKEKYADGCFVLVAVANDDIPIAFGDLMDPGHIDLLYCHPDFAGQGIASKLTEALEAEARKRSLARLTVDASEPAKPLFEQKGFAVIRRNDLTIDGVAIHNYSMKKVLAGSALCD